MMLIPNAIPAIPSDLILDVEQQRHTTVLEDNVARKGKSEILTGVVAPVLFTLPWGYGMCAHQKCLLYRDEIPDEWFPRISEFETGF